MRWRLYSRSSSYSVNVTPLSLYGVKGENQSMND